MFLLLKNPSSSWTPCCVLVEGVCSPSSCIREYLCLLLFILIVNVSETVILLLQDECFFKVFLLVQFGNHNLVVHFPLNDTKLSTCMPHVPSSCHRVALNAI